MLYFVIVIIGLSALIIVHELGHFFVARYFGLLIEEFGFGIPPRIFGKKIGETLITLNWLPIGGFVKIFGLDKESDGATVPDTRNFRKQALWKRALIIGAGIGMNFIIGWFLLAVVYMIGIPQSLVITDIQEQSIAESSGLLTGDRLLDFSSRDQLVGFLDSHGGQEVMMKIQRGKEILTIPIIPRVVVPRGEGNLGVFLVETGMPQLNFIQSFGAALKNSLIICAGIFMGLIQLFIGIFSDWSMLNNFVGPVGIVNVAVEQTKLGLPYFFQLLSLISLNLAIFNLIPIPALDGGKLFLLLIEKIKGKPLTLKTEVIANSIGFAFLLLLIISVTIKDIARLF
ncbi:MAG TPA: M50 family metallopeptidase [Candidatus Paceibacterota bacterium]